MTPFEASVAYHMPWETVDWWARPFEGAAVVVHQDTCLALQSVTWSLASMSISLEALEEGHRPRALTREALLSLIGDAHVVFVGSKGYDLRYCDQGAFEVLQPSFIFSKAPVHWVSGIHPMPGCLYLTKEGLVQTESENAFWTSYHAYPHTHAKVATRLLNIQGMSLSGHPLTYNKESDFVYTVEGSPSGFQVIQIEVF